MARVEDDGASAVTAETRPIGFFKKGHLPATAFTSATAPRNGGRRAIPREIIDILEAKTPDAARRLCEMVDSADDDTALKAIEALFAHLYVRPPVAIQATLTEAHPAHAFLERLAHLEVRVHDPIDAEVTHARTGPASRVSD